MEDQDVASAIEATGRRRLILAGIGTDVCAVFPALHALRDGYEVQVVADACVTDSELSHQAALRRMEPGGATITNTAQVIAELARDWSTPEGGELVRIMTQR